MDSETVPVSMKPELIKALNKVSAEGAEIVRSIGELRLIDRSPPRLSETAEKIEILAAISTSPVLEGLLLVYAAGPFEASGRPERASRDYLTAMDICEQELASREPLHEKAFVCFALCETRLLYMRTRSQTELEKEWRKAVRSCLDLIEMHPRYASRRPPRDVICAWIKLLGKMGYENGASELMHKAQESWAKEIRSATDPQDVENLEDALRDLEKFRER